MYVTEWLAQVSILSGTYGSVVEEKATVILTLLKTVAEDGIIL